MIDQEYQDHRHTGLDSQRIAIKDTEGTLEVERGGTGLTSPGASGNVLTSNGTSLVSQPPAQDPYGVNSKYSTYHTFTFPWISNGAGTVAGAPLSASYSGLDTASEWHGAYGSFKSNSSSAYVRFRIPGVIGSNNEQYGWADNKKIILAFNGLTFGSAGFIWGLASGSDAFYQLNHTGSNAVTFMWDGANATMKVLTSNGSANTRTTIAGIDGYDWNAYRMEIDLVAGNVKFYINNILVATHTTNLPSTGNVYCGMGIDTSTRFIYMTPPIISIEQ